jgi:glycopeptide antibiotics resistance protein
MVKAKKEARDKIRIKQELLSGPKTKILRTLFWLFSVSWMALIFWLSSSPDAQGGLWFLDLIPFHDKGAHALAFGFLAVLLYFASGRFWIAFLLTSLYGLSDEIHQHFVPGRSADVTDWIADTVGAALALVVLWFMIQARAKKAS